MKNSAIAKKLAAALMDVGKSEGTAGSFGKDLVNLIDVFRAASEIYGVLLNPMLGLPERLGLMQEVSRAAEVNPVTEKFMNYLVESRHIRLLEDIERAYARLDDELSGRLRAVIEAPDELGEGLLSEIKTRLTEITGKDVVLDFTSDPSLIGGLVIKMENTVIDGSIRTQLELLRTKMIARG